MQNCKTKKCCMGPKVTELIKSYLRQEIPHIPDDDIVEMMKTEKNYTEEMQRKQAIKMALPQSRAAKNLLPSTNSAISPNTFTVKSVTTRTRGRRMGDTASTETHTKQNRDSASAASRPLPGPP